MRQLPLCLVPKSKQALRSTGDIVCSYSGDGSDGFFELTAPGTSKPAFDGESDIPPSDPRSPKWHPMRKSRWDAEVTGSEATMSCIEYGVPQIGNRITVTSKSGEVLSEETVDFGDCWNRYSYQRTFELINDTDLPTRFEVMPQSEASTALASAVSSS